MSAGVVIVGARLAGQRCCEALRARGWDGPIRLAGQRLQKTTLEHERSPA